jgi:replication factor C subunit 2/4
MQSTYAGFQRLSPDAVFKVCDQPHPMLVTQVLKMCMARNFTEAVKIFHGAYPYLLRLHRIT